MADLNKLLKQKQSEKKGRADASLPPAETQPILNTVREIEIARVFEDVSQPRKEYNQEKILALAESIKEKGLIQPIIVKQSGKGYMIIAGHRRFRAFLALGRPSIPCIIKDEVLTETDLTELALIENLQREDLNALEIAASIYQLKQIRDIKQREIAAVTGYSESNISKYIQLYDAVKDNDKKKDRVIQMGFKRAYTAFCADKSRKKEKAKNAEAGATLLIQVKNVSDKAEIKAAIKRTEKFLLYLQGVLKELSR